MNLTVENTSYEQHKYSADLKDKTCKHRRP